MKKPSIIKLSILGLVLIVLASCTKDMTKLNDNPKGPAVVPGESLVSQAQANLANYYTTPDVNTNIFELIMQYWAETTYPQETQYILVDRNIPRFWWQALYTTILKNLETAKQLIAAEDIKPVPGAQDPSTRANKVAITEICEVYTWALLVNTFGNIPYTEALDFTKATPKYDDQKTVFYALTDSLDAALAQLDPSGISFGTADLLYGGNVTSWIKFANTLKLRMGMQLADVDPAKAKTMVEAAAPGAFASNADNALFKFLAVPPNTNPIWTNLVQSNRDDFVPTNTLINQMNAGEDPRLSAYFTFGPNDGVYVGGITGNGNTYVNFSHVTDAIKVPTFPTLLLDFAEVQFFKAEAVERGFNIGDGDARSHYDSAVTASIVYWGGSATDAAAYLAKPGVSYTTATWQERIGVQQWIAYNLRGFDAWTSWRRLGWPKIVAPSSAISATPVRLTYPDNEQTLNETNWTAASAAIGGDLVTTKLFWMK